MTDIPFRKVQETAAFLGADGAPIRRVIEVRYDPLTGAASRVRVGSAPAPQVPDYSAAAARTGGAQCPFCPENLQRLTPRFAAGDGGPRMRGEVAVFPNLFPYTAHNAVVVLGSVHYRRLTEFPVALLVDGFAAAQDYVANTQAHSAEPLHAAINWNYLPASGGSILHPHLHATLSATETNYQRDLREHGAAFRERTGQDYLSALCAAEEKDGARWIGTLGGVRWLHAFAPTSDNDFIGVLPVPRIADVQPAHWQALARGLRALFVALTEQGLASFNLVLTEVAGLPVHVRLASRRSYGALDTSDINFWQLLHREPLSACAPEAVAAIARKHLQAAR